MSKLKTFKHSIRLDGVNYYTSAYLANNKKSYDNTEFVKIGNTVYYKSKNQWMKERDLRGTWKVKNPGIKKLKHPIFGMIYSGDGVVGVYVEDEGEFAILQTKDGEKKKVLKKNLKHVASS